MLHLYKNSGSAFLHKMLSNFLLLFYSLKQRVAAGVSVMMIKIILLMSVLLSLNAHASVYRCVLDGVTIFSQTPCAQDAEKLSQYDTSPTIIREDALVMTADDSLLHISRQERQQSLHRQLQQLERQARQLEQDRDTRLAELTDGEVQSAEQLGEQSYPPEIANEIVAVFQDYLAKLSQLHQQAEVIQQQLQDL